MILNPFLIRAERPRPQAGERSPASRSLLLAFVAILPTTGVKAVKLPAVIGDNMVLQQGRKAPIWGTADSGEEISVTLSGQRASVVADAEGRWRVSIGPFQAGGPFELVVSGKNTITLHNILVGEVWVASGQSNMEMALHSVSNAPGEISSANFPKMRLFTVKHAVAGRPQQDVDGQWTETNPQSVANFSAVAFFFGRELNRTLGVPIGLVQTCWGGTPAEAWAERQKLESDPELKPVVDQWEESLAAYPNLLERFQQQFDQWKHKVQTAEAEGSPAPSPPAIPTDPRINPWRPAGLFNAMIAPLVPYAIEGVIWYQGESNATRASQYRKLFPTMIRDWRGAWGQGDFPFLFVQLANFQPTDPSNVTWAELREAQALALSLPKTGMAVAVDIGEPNDIHPKNKQDVGHRLALAAEAIAYGRHVVYSGPMYDSWTTEGKKVRVRFKHAPGGLLAKGGALRGFEVAGADHKFVAASARIEGQTVVVSAENVADPTAVRYAWTNNPQGNLYNRAGLPASPFRTDGGSSESALPGGGATGPR